MSDNVIIRKATLDDAETIVRFNMLMAQETEGKKLDQKVLSDGVKSVFEDSSRGFYLVAEIDNIVAGSLLVTFEWSDWRNGLFWWVQSVYVDKDYRRRGVFRAMYQEIRQQAIAVPGVCGCRLYVEQDNDRAQATYETLGFEKTSYILFEDEF